MLHEAEAAIYWASTTSVFGRNYFVSYSWACEETDFYLNNNKDMTA